MFGSIIKDAFSLSEIRDMAFAIDDICSPKDNIGWASAGIYSFWDYYTHEIYYIGLARDLCERFKQHTNLLPVTDGSSKYRYILEYFGKRDKLGYTIFVQSPLSQPKTHRNQHMYDGICADDLPVNDFFSEQGQEDIVVAEGIFIESYRQVVGRLPEWNRIGGSVSGSERSSRENYMQIVRAFSESEKYHYLVAKSSIREISGNATYLWYEENLHALRMMMLTMGCTFSEALDLQQRLNPYWDISYKRIIDDNYLEKELIL